MMFSQGEPDQHFGSRRLILAGGDPDARLSSLILLMTHPGFVGSGLTSDRRGIRDDGRRNECSGSPNRTCVFQRPIMSLAHAVWSLERCWGAD